jgi:hypothetical protein
MISYYDTNHTFLLINYCATLDFYMRDMYDTAYNTLIVASLKVSL